MKIEIEMSERLYKKDRVAAKNLNLSSKKFLVRAIRKSALANQEKKLSDAEVTASLNAFFEQYPELKGGWWEDRSWDDYQPRKENRDG